MATNVGSLLELKITLWALDLTETKPNCIVGWARKARVFWDLAWPCGDDRALVQARSSSSNAWVLRSYIWNRKIKCNVQPCQIICQCHSYAYPVHTTSHHTNESSNYKVLMLVVIKSFPLLIYFFLLNCLHGLLPGPFLLNYSVLFFKVFLIFPFLVSSSWLRWLSISFWAHVGWLVGWEINAPLSAQK